MKFATAAAINLSRMWAWWSNVPLGKTRVSRFACVDVVSNRPCNNRSLISIDKTNDNY
ncbi:MAG: hypothetical protein RM022_008395 [Nostoc sp. EfeVER01]|uniref:hypothetical protein n=1 Tax=unclassified Nostoc TaxID=2593658 RepID=UPI002AD2A191|nr:MULTISPECIES: hypothetical protein [unclassified Nostoc]MDZ7943606.1 hypothetical protein [Nostoc sp. EfeVER01]MDZ7992681.1 hypothetical protein [Nostoc sp. EspVER01]